VLLAKHAQHAVFIHFPIVLFAAGVLFDFLTHQTKRRGLAEATNFNFLVAAISTAFLARQFALEGQKLKGTLLEHSVLVFVSTAMIWLAWWVRAAGNGQRLYRIIAWQLNF
jgi:uncharacterized membrane protein